MAQHVDEICSALNSLIQTCRDGEHGYRTAASDVHNSELESIFLGYAEQRTKFAKELHAEVARLEGTVADSGSVSAAVHRGWMNVKAALTGSSAAAIIAACETGEDAAAAAYERVIDSVLPGETRSLVERQRQQVKEAHSHMLRLKGETQRGNSFTTNE